MFVFRSLGLASGEFGIDRPGDVGYQFYVSPHWNLELSAGAGLVRLNYHTEPIDGSQASASARRTKVLPIPTELGVSFVYLFNSRK